MISDFSCSVYSDDDDDDINDDNVRNRNADKFNQYLSMKNGEHNHMPLFEQKNLCRLIEHRCFKMIGK